MDKILLLQFIGLNISNVIIQTIKSIATIKCGKGIAALVNAVAFGLYTVVTVYMLCDLPLFWKAGIVALCNLIGVYAVKWGEEKTKKDKLWKIEATVSTSHKYDADLALKEIPQACIKISDKHTKFECYCSTQAETKKAKAILDKYNPKYFVSESKITF